MGKGRQPCRRGCVAWERGLPPTRSSSASQNLPVTLALSQRLVSLPCVFMRTLRRFSDALVCGSESFCALPAGLSALACDVRFPFPCHIPLSLARRSAGDLHFPEAWYCGLLFPFLVFLLRLTTAASSWVFGSVLPLLLSLRTGLAAPLLTSPWITHLLHNPLDLQPCCSLTLANLLSFAILLSTFPSGGLQLERQV